MCTQTDKHFKVVSFDLWPGSIDCVWLALAPRPHTQWGRGHLVDISIKLWLLLVQLYNFEKNEQASIHSQSLTVSGHATWEKLKVSEPNNSNNELMLQTITTTTPTSYWSDVHWIFSYVNFSPDFHVRHLDPAVAASVFFQGTFLD